MLETILLAILVAVIVGLVCLLLGKVLASLAVPPAAAVGGFLVQYCWVIGVVAGLWYFVSGGDLPFS